MFHRSFPDAQAFHVTTLSAEKCCVVNKPSISPQVLRSQLKPWLDLSNVHVFIQPLLGNLMFVNLDGYRKTWDCAPAPWSNRPPATTRHGICCQLTWPPKRQSGLQISSRVLCRQHEHGPKE